MTAVLHTWGQNLSRHVHVHCLIPGGVLTESSDWHKAKNHYLFPVRALSRRFRGRMVSMLRAAVNAGELHRVTRSGEVDGVLNGLMQHEWVVYTRHCLNQAESVVDYLARYTHRIAISNGRLLTMEDDRISFRYKDYRDGSRIKTQWLEGQEFVRRFLMHILPNEGLHANSPFWLPEQLHSTPQTGGYPALFIAAAQIRSDTGESGVSAMLALPPL